MAARDWIVSPTYLPDLAHACLDLLIDGESGVWHLANAGSESWVDFAHRGASEADLDRSFIRGCSARSWLTGAAAGVQRTGKRKGIDAAAAVGFG